MVSGFLLFTHLAFTCRVRDLLAPPPGHMTQNGSRQKKKKTPALLSKPISKLCFKQNGQNTSSQLPKTQTVFNRNTHSLLCVFVITICFPHSLEYQSRDAETQRLDQSDTWMLNPGCPFRSCLRGACVNVTLKTRHVLRSLSIQAYNIRTRCQILRYERL